MMLLHLVQSRGGNHGGEEQRIWPANWPSYPYTQ
jgi:hypothetical protein